MRQTERELYCKHNYQLIYKLPQVSETCAKYQCKKCLKIIVSERKLKNAIHNI